MSGGLLDEFGQTLGTDTTLTFTVGDAHADVLRTERHGRARSGGEEADARLLHARTTSSSRSGSTGRRRPTTTRTASTCGTAGTRTSRRRCPARRCSISSSRRRTAKNELVETSLDLKPALDRAGLGHAIAIVEPYPWTEDWDPPRLMIAGCSRPGSASTRSSTRATSIAFATDLAHRQAGRRRRARDPAVRDQGRPPTTRAWRRSRCERRREGLALSRPRSAAMTSRSSPTNERLLERVRQLDQAERAATASPGT